MIRLALILLVLLGLAVTLNTAMTKVSYDSANLVEVHW